MNHAAAPAHPLTDADVAFALRIAAAFGRGYPRLADECESAALVGLAQAWAKFDPAKSGVPFRLYAAHRVAGEVRDSLRRWAPRGFSRRDAPQVSHLGGHATPLDVEADEPPSATTSTTATRCGASPAACRSAARPPSWRCSPTG